MLPRCVSAIPAVTALFTAVACAAPDPPPPSISPIWTDGTFADWDGIAAAVTDPPGDTPPGSPVDLRAVTIQDDPRYLHLLIDLGHTVTAQGMPGSVEVALDADGDPGTGGLYAGVEGADLAIVLSRQRDPAVDAHGAGVGIRRIGPGGAGEPESARTVGLLVSPTHSSDRFEMRLDRDAITAGAVGDTSNAAHAITGRVVYLRAGNVVDETPVFTHVLATASGDPPPLLGADALAKPPGALRVVMWNVSDGNFRDTPDPFSRVLAALGADVALLDEVYADVTLADLSRFSDVLVSASAGLATESAGLPANQGLWNWWLAEGGGRQRTAIGAPGRDVRGEPLLARIDHAPGTLDRWLQEVGDEPEAPRMAPPSALARAEAEGGLSATGAWVTVGRDEILFVPVDLQSAGHDGSPRDRLRELQALTLNRAIDAALADRPDAGLVVGGDLNLVGSARPLDELVRGLGVGGTDLDVARAERVRERSLATWRSTRSGDPFSPGRLDYVLYRGAVLQVERAFVFDAADLSEAARQELGLCEEDTRHSDHLPLVVDFRLR